MADVEETIKRIQSQKGVVGVIVMDNAGQFSFDFLTFGAIFSITPL